MDSPVTQAQFAAFLAEFGQFKTEFRQLKAELSQLKENSVTKHDLLHVVLLVQTAYFAVVVGTIVVLNIVGLP